MEAPKGKDGMTRNMEKLIDEYHKLIEKKGGNFGAFYLSDVKQLQKIAEDKGGISFKNIVSEAIINSLEAGFMIGYRAGLREARKNAKG